MTDSQLLTLAIAVIVPLSLLLYSNSRITDTKETLRAEIGETKQTLRLETRTLHAEIGETRQALRLEMQTLRGDMELGFERLSNKMDHLAGEVATLKELMSTHIREHHNFK